MNIYQTVFVTSEVHLCRDASGTFWSTLPTLSFDELRRYLQIGQRVVVVARVIPGSADIAGPVVNGEGVEVAAVPYYHGLRGLLLTLPRLLSFFARLPGRDSLFVGRIPETLTFLLYATARIKRSPFLAFLVADPQVSLPFPKIGHPLKRVVTLRMIRGCVGVVYVTKHWLQNRYPAPPGLPTLSRSNVSLPPEAFHSKESYRVLTHTPHLVTIGTMGSTSKGHDFLIKVVHRMAQVGQPVSLTIVGDGPIRPALEQQVRQLGVMDRVRFAGATTTAAENRTLLDRSDIFVFGSRTEGLPRAVIEAMARGLPVVSTNAGGIGELLAPEVVVPIDDEVAFVRALSPLLLDEGARAEQGHRNEAQARAIRDSTAEPVLISFLRRVAEAPVERRVHKRSMVGPSVRTPRVSSMRRAFRARRSKS